MAKKKHRIEFREFLNLPGWKTRAYVMAVVEDTSKRDTKVRNDRDPSTYNIPHPDLVFNIGDCSADVHLEFDTWDPLEADNNIHKAEVIYQAAKKFRDAMKKEMALYKKRRAALIKKGIKEKDIN